MNLFTLCSARRGGSVLRLHGEFLTPKEEHQNTEEQTIMDTTTEERKAVSVLPWGIEADHPRNRDLLIQGIPGCKLRSKITGMRTTVDVKTGEEVVPRDQAIAMGSYPVTPGMQLIVYPADLVYEIVDPLRDDFQLLDRLKRFLKSQTGFDAGDRFNGVEKLTGKLDVHRMKTLCREMVYLVQSGEAKKVKGALPTIADIEELPGHFLLNPGARIQTTQPIYEKDWSSWVDRLSHSGM